MYLGVKVVRGPDWKWGDQNCQEGMVGTIVRCGERSNAVVLNGTVFVMWDNGSVANYRVGRDGAYDLLLFHNRACGVKHDGYQCCGCSKNNYISGIRWQCAVCKDISLCSECYGLDKHDRQHEFLRFDWPSSKGCEVPARSSSQKLEAKGIFPDAKVVRGPDWSWKDQDGGKGNVGLVLKFKEDSKERAEWYFHCKVIWITSFTNLYRIGCEGKMDLVVVEPASGGHYYPTHLARLGHEESLPGDENYQLQSDSIKVGSKVKITVDEYDALHALQQDHGGWNPGLNVLIGCIGKIKGTFSNGDLVVKYTEIDQVVRLNPAVVSVVASEDEGRDVDNDDDEASSDDDDDDDGDESIRTSADSSIQLPFIRRLIMQNQLKMLAATGNDDGVRSFLTLHSGDLNEESKNEALQEAVSKGHVEVVRLLVAAGADVSAKDNFDNAPIHLAVVENHPVVLNALAEYEGCKLNVTNCEGFTALHLAVHYGHVECIEILLDRGCDPNVTDGEGLTALHRATRNLGSTRVVDVLTQPGVQISYHVADKSGFTVLHHAAQSNNSHAAGRILQRALYVADCTTGDGVTALHIAAEMGHIETAETLVKIGRANLEMKTIMNCTPLLLAVRHGSAAVIELLVSNGANVNCPDGKGNTPLRSALSYCNQKAESIPVKHLERAEVISKILNDVRAGLLNRSWIAVSCYLIRSGADVGWGNCEGLTPLYQIREDEDVVSAVLKYIDAQRCVQQCMKCAMKTVMATLLPCGHQNICPKCCGKLKSCMKCLRNISSLFVPDAKVNSGHSVQNPEDDQEDNSADLGPESCRRCLKQRNFMFRPCQHTCCDKCVDKIGNNCPHCGKDIKRPLVILYAGGFY